MHLPAMRPLRSDSKLMVVMAVLAQSMMLQALGVVYGDIGTSPLYAYRESLHHAGVTESNILGIASLIWWSLWLVVTLKYVVIILRAHHKGEGGITALLSILKKKVGAGPIIFGLIGVALLFADGVITPAISVLSAVEGITTTWPSMANAVVPITVMILIGLFSIQYKGTKVIGVFFGPIMALWFLSIGLIGSWQIIQNPTILRAVSPWYAVNFFQENGMIGFFTLSAVVLAVTGGEALYADLGHFGAPAIRKGWLYVAMPCLVLNYFGQGAYALSHMEEVEHINLFFAIVPGFLQVPMVILATMATVIASQALITGAFSLTRQLIRMHNLPEIDVIGTNKHHHGQIYVPAVNKMLLVGCIALVFWFQTSSALAGAYGLAVTGTMAITTLLFWLVLTRVWVWPVRLVRFKQPLAALLTVPFLLIDLTFFASNLSKIKDGGYIPLTIAVVLTVFMQRYYVHTKKLRKTRKCSLDIVVSAETPTNSRPKALVFLGDYIDVGYSAMMKLTRELGLDYELVHIVIDEDRAIRIQEHLARINARIPIMIDSPSGEVRRPAVEFAVEYQRHENVIALIGEPLADGPFGLLHDTGERLARALGRAGIPVQRVPWHVTEEMAEAAGSVSLVPVPVMASITIEDGAMNGNGHLHEAATGVTIELELEQ